MYVVLDIESSGGAYNQEGIMEIAAFRYDGKTITDQLISLVNPQRDIQPYVQKLTGITPNMLVRAPRFHEVAKRIVELTEGAILVGHNVEFDYRMLRLEFGRLGYEFERPTLDTVELAKQLIPELTAFKLEKVCEALNIHLPKAHHAEHDARATLDLLRILQEKDLGKKIPGRVRYQGRRQGTPEKLEDLLLPLKDVTGVFYLHDQEGNVLYMGQSNAVRSELNRIFMADVAPWLELQEAVEDVRVEETGSLVLAQIKEMLEQQASRPKFNKKVTHFPYPISLRPKQMRSGFMNLIIKKFQHHPDAVGRYRKYSEALDELGHWAEDRGLCLALLGLEPKGKACSLAERHICRGACEGRESAEDYNEKFTEALSYFRFDDGDAIYLDHGRKPGEHAFFYVEAGKFCGYGYVDLQDLLSKKQVLEKRMTRFVPNPAASALLRKAIVKGKVNRHEAPTLHE